MCFQGGILSLAQVDSNFCGRSTCLSLEKGSPAFMEVKPSHCQIQIGASLGNIAMVKDIGLSNRQKLYQEVCRAVLRNSSSIVSNVCNPQESKIPFKVARIAADGRCGWRSILACQDINSHRNVPRTGMCASVWRICCWPLSSRALQDWGPIPSKQAPQWDGGDRGKRTLRQRMSFAWVFKQFAHGFVFACGRTWRDIYIYVYYSTFGGI